MDDATTAWLLDGDPAIRWQVMEDLLDAPADDVARERQRVATDGWGALLLSHRDPAGTWAGGLYGPKWVSTTYTLLLLWRCGVPPSDQLADSVRLLYDGARYQDGGLTPAVDSSVPEGCVTAMYVTLARYFGYDDERVDEAQAWLYDHQLEDGGWNCRHLRTGDRHSSFHTSISTLEALAQVRATTSDPAAAAALETGREFFLAHRLFKSHRTGEIVHPTFTMLSFPPRWHYDVLRGLDHFQAEQAPWDERLADAVELLQSKRRSDGRWPVQHKHQGRVWFDMESGRAPSRWNTLRALRVLRWVDGVRG